MRAMLLLSPNHAAAGAAPAFISLATVLQNLSCSIQNCNSLNVSTSCPRQTKKIKSITDLCSDIIFVSDLRLNNSDSINDIEKIFLSSSSHQYNFYHNSTKSSRGAGILISTKIDCELISSFKDMNENILGLLISISGKEILLISIYGPNITDNIFFQDLNYVILSNPNIPVIIG